MMSRPWIARAFLSRPERLLPTSALGIALLAYLALPVYAGGPPLAFDTFNALQFFARLAPLVLGLGLTMFAGEFDLSIVGTYALGGMLAVQYGGTHWATGIAVALAAGAVIGAVQGALVARFNISSMPVTLGTYIALLGLTKSISGGLSKTYDNISVTLWVDRQIAVILSPRSLLALAAFVVIGLILGCSRWGREVRAIGSDRRASRVSGVRADRLLIGLFATSGVLAAASGALLNFSLGAANPDPGTQPLILAAVGALLGGVSLAGGRGTVVGLLAGALTVSLLAQIVTAAGLQGYLAQLFYAALLVLIVAVEAPGLRRAWTRTSVRLHSRRSAERTRPTDSRKVAS
ncbi:ABC transporter permease [Streptomyces aquilus]|uniref:ABC transporter permease n=1 Tax=Streptomyces aquilus TaxID=2548456 RepID=A0A3S9HRQ9_9ACTN|nr:ABC transporter permease [Streptomyces aquilus]AZP14801.1 ABC transporter permease [Streptomyces aquilus]